MTNSQLTGYLLRQVGTMRCVDCVLLSMEESGWKNCTDCVLDVAVLENVDLFMDSFCISDCGEADWISN